MRYYSTQRPLGPGTFPKPLSNPILNFANYIDRTFIASIGKEAWGEITYTNPLSDDDIKSYELTPERNETNEIEEDDEEHEGRFYQDVDDLAWMFDTMIAMNLSESVCEEADGLRRDIVTKLNELFRIIRDKKGEIK